MQTYTDDAGLSFTATVTGHTLTIYVPRQAHIERIKIPPQKKGKIGHALKRKDFHAFAAAVDDLV